MLAPGGKLVYSTCTFDRDEDEGTIEYILEKYPQMAVVPQKPEYGFEGSRGIEGCLRLFPHRLEGEGHFLALLEKRTEKTDANVKDLENADEKALSDPLLLEEIEARLCRVAEDGKSRQMASGKAKGKTFGKGKNVAQNQTSEDFSPLFELLRQLPVRTWNPEQFYRDSERIYYLPAALAGDNTRYFKPLRCLRTGLLLGELKKGRFEPSQALAMNLRMQEFVNYLNFNASDERTIRYLKGETLTAAEEEAADGLVLICFLAEMKQGTRSQVKEMIRKGRVLVDGIVCRESDRKIFPDETRVTMDGQPVGWADTEYYMLNKPQGVVSATEDGRYQTVIDLIDEAKRKDLFPVGRLDIDTEGLLLITNDGALAHELLAPKKHVDKVYFARVKGTLKEGIEARFQAGLTLTDGTPVRPAELVIEKKWNDAGEDFCEARLTIHEGKFHQVKRMFEAEGGEVIYLKRLSMGPLALDEALATGEYRALTEDEIRALKERTLTSQNCVSNDENLSDTPNNTLPEINWNTVDAVLFDLDGTLVDSMWMWKAIDVEFLKRYGYD